MRFFFVAVLCVCFNSLRAEDVSAPAILQYFESRYETIEERAADIFKAGYGIMFTPPPGRADSGNSSVGYDQYDRFDLGGPSNYTLYGSETGLKTVIKTVHRAACDYYIDLVLNHDGFSDLGSTDGNGVSFYDAGGYPGMCITLPQAVDGDFHSKYATGDLDGRLAGLIDIDHTTNWRFYRSPVPGIVAGPNDGGNIRAGTKYAFGRIANVPDINNTRFYPDQTLNPIRVYDPNTGEQNIPIYPFNLANPYNGTPVPENVLGYLMRHTQWLVQTCNVDGFRLDAAKNFDGFVLNYYDRAVYRSSFHNLLNGQQRNVFAFAEAYDGNQDYLQTFVVKTINPNDPGTIGGNRDTLDFPLFFALQSNLSSNGLNNDWHNIENASLDFHDDGLHNGSQGVMFVSSHDDFGPDLSNVAYAYVLMNPGNAIVYFNAHEFGDANARPFPKDGRGDALGGMYGNTITALVDIRNRYGRGNYVERWLEKENFAYERSGSALVLLSNRSDAGYDSRTLLTNFNGGTRLIELTGNAASGTSNPFQDVPQLLVVNNDHTVNVRFLRNVAPGTNNFTGNGYLIYGLPAPQGTLSLTNVAFTIAGGTPTAATNGTTRINDMEVITADSFQVKLTTIPVNLLGSIREREADGDNALIRIDEGIDVNGNGRVDYTTPGATNYGFEEFVTQHNPGYFDPNGNGTYVQTIDATKLSEGMHFITVRCYRHRDDGGPAIFTDFRQTIYVDRKPPLSAIDSFNPLVVGVNENRQLRVRSTDQTANSVHVFMDLPASKTSADIINMTSAQTQAGKIDRDLFAYGFNNVSNGNHVFSVVSFERTGNVNVQRFPGFYTSTINGAGLGDTDFDGQYTPNDITIFRTLLASNNTQFNPAADLNGDGVIDSKDLTLLGTQLTTVNASAATKLAYDQLVNDVSPFNNPPVANPDNVTTPENTLLQIPAATLLANDSPGPGAEHVQILTVISVSAASMQGGTVSLNGSTVTYMPAANFNGNDTFTYTITDNGTSNGAADYKTATGTVTVTVTEVNQPPTANPDNVYTPKNTPLSILASSLTANDIAGPMNESNQTLTITAVSPTSAQAGTVALNGTTVTYTPPNNYIGPDTFTYTVTDNGTTNGVPDFKTATGIVNVNVTDPATNQPPITNPVNVTTAENAQIQIAAALLLANDSPGPSNESAQTLALTAVSAASTQGGTVALNGNNVTYTPPAHFNGADSFTVTVTDNGAPPASATGLVLVTVTEVNDPPILNPDTVTTPEDAPLDVAASFLLLNDAPGPDNESSQTLTVTAVSATSTQGGTVVLNGAIVSYTPPLHFYGADTFIYTATDNGTTNGAPDPKSSTCTVTVNVTAVNQPPIANPDTITAQQNSPRLVAVSVLLSNDSPGPSNESAQTLTLTGVSAASTQGGTVTLNANVVTYTPPSGFSGTDTFTYTITDNGLTDGTPDPKTATGTVTVNVGAINQPPTAFPDSIIAFENEALTFSKSILLANDIPGPPSESAQTLTVTGVTLASSQGGSVALNGANITYTPPPQFTGADSFSYSITDNGLSLGVPDPKVATGVVTVLVQPKNHAPVIVSAGLTPQNALVNEEVDFTVSATDVDNDPIAFAWDFGDGVQGAGAAPSHFYTKSGAYTATVSASDGKGGVASSQMSVTIDTTSGLSIVKASIKLNFKPGSKPADSMTFSGTLAVPAALKFNGAEVDVNISGITQTFLLDAKGHAKTAAGASLTIATKPKNGVSKFALSFKKGSYSAALAASGLTNADAKNVAVQVPVSIKLPGHSYAANAALHYTAKMNVSGAAK
ncbi:MAG TPA: Ig-like domain-containing protein [Planctomycetota bacterium]|nr:Ig-like domain-containing protein [Planctomycetota bacterium]